MRTETDAIEKMEEIARIAENFEGLLRLMVDFPDEVSVLPVPDGKGFILEVAVANRDIGKVIGKAGRTARALRTIVQAVSMTNKIQITLDIVEDQRANNVQNVATR